VILIICVCVAIASLVIGSSKSESTSNSGETKTKSGTSNTSKHSPCKDGYVPAAQDSKKCLPIAGELNGPCETDSQCNLSPMLGRLSKCDNQTRSCVCYDTKTPSNTLPDDVYWDEETKQCKKTASYKGPLVVIIGGGIIAKIFRL